MLPAFFFGHGNPMNALASNNFTQVWSAIGGRVPFPKAIVAISAHWYIDSTRVTAMSMPRTIHDFSGFPPVLSQMQYPAPGKPELATRITELLAPVTVGLDYQWGLDHGTWSILHHIYPQSNIPVIQLSMDATQPASFHYALGKRLAVLRDEGVLIIGSGNIVHNLRAYMWDASAAPLAATTRFEQCVRERLLAGDHTALINYAGLGADVEFAIPSPEHYLPLLYILGLQQDGEKITFPVEGHEGGSISMLSVEINGEA